MDMELLSPPREVKLMFVVPEYKELRDIGDSGIYVALNLTKVVTPQLQFWKRAAVTAECFNSDSGCPRCTYVDILRELALLDRKGILRISGEYDVYSGKNFASLTLNIEEPNEKLLEEQQAYEFAVHHLRADFEPLIQEEEALAAAVHSSCHVVGCTQHQRQPPLLLSHPGLPPPLSMPSMVVSASEGQLLSSSSSETSTDENSNLYDLLRSLKVCFEGPSDVTSNGDVPGLKLKLFQHQCKGLAWMLQRERPERCDTVIEHPFSSGD
ncbi:hypothetical protein P3T76_013700 [Phytophthora citrophthora]|uniref:Uncharacterized protein n=1 Tax=Phytophthora citrophthora TaxID=4793 RepID=A0AAD9LBR8_9STRA|nr:hypothetical protein P3T76_013700 [Phytophthora citrophthora]